MANCFSARYPSDINRNKMSFPGTLFQNAISSRLWQHGTNIANGGKKWNCFNFTSFADFRFFFQTEAQEYCTIGRSVRWKMHRVPRYGTVSMQLFTCRCVSLSLIPFRMHDRSLFFCVTQQEATCMQSISYARAWHSTSASIPCIISDV